MTDSMVLWSPGVTLEAIEKQVILKAFRHYRGNKTATANALGIAIRTLDYKLEKYTVDAKTEKEKDNEGQRQREQFLARQRGYVPDNLAGFQAPKPPEQSKPATQLNAGPVMESPANPATQSPVPVPKRAEIQSVLPAQAKPNGAYKRR